MVSNWFRIFVSKIVKPQQLKGIHKYKHRKTDYVLALWNLLSLSLSLSYSQSNIPLYNENKSRIIGMSK